ncbi:MAG: DUF4839 domain-containing protein [Actinoplanes sp.]
MASQQAPLKKWQIVAFGIGAVVLAGIITVGAITEKKDEPVAAAASAGPAKTGAAKTPATVEPAATEVTLTAKNNKDLKALLAANDIGLFQDFATEYQGQNIEFDGEIADLAQHGDYKTRYDILIYATTKAGPAFQFNDVNITSDLHLTGSNIPATITAGQKLHIVATVEEFTQGELLLLDPVSTKVE